MATKKANPAKSKKGKSNLVKAAETVGTIAGTLVRKKNQLVKDGEVALHNAKKKTKEVIANAKQKAATVVASAKKAAGNLKSDKKSVVKQVKRKAIKAGVNLAAAGVVHKVEKKVKKVKKAVKKAVK